MTTSATTCHPVLSTDARVALTLRLLGGLTTTEIARAFLAPEPTVAPRIVRAKRTLAAAGVPFEVPAGDELEVRLSSVLEVVYLVFNEGYSATSGDDWMRPALCDEALRLGRILAGLAPQESEVHGLLALMEIQASRSAARTDASGEPVPLLDQNRSRWDLLLIVDTLASEPSPTTYHLLPSVRGDLLEKLGRPGEAPTEFERAASLTHNERERELLLKRSRACAPNG
jgi:predicted RNA polymerase sigma factor